MPRSYDAEEIPADEVKLAPDKSQIDIGAPEEFDVDTLSPTTRELVENGTRDGHEYAGPSEVRMAAISALLREGVSNEAILFLLLDPLNAISERTNGFVTEKYGREEIKRARAKFGSSAADDFGDNVDPKWLKGEEAKAKSSRFVGRSMSELRALGPLTYLVGGLIPVNSLFEIYGPRKSGKTFLALDIGLCIVTGTEFHGSQIKQGRVLHIIGEGNIAAVRDRVDAWVKTYANSPEQKSEFDSVIEKSWRLVGVPVHIDIAETLKEFLAANPGPWDLIIVDTMLRNMAGHISDPKDMAAFVAACDRIRGKTKAAVLVIHHEGKDKTKGGMGSMVFDAAVDGVAKFHRSGNKRILSVVVLRDAPDDVDDMIFEIKPVTLPAKKEGDPDVSSAVIEFVERKAKSETDMTAGDRLLSVIYLHSGATREDLAKELGVTTQAISKTAAGLRAKGLMPKDGYTLTSTGITAAQSLYDFEDGNDENSDPF